MRHLFNDRKVFYGRGLIVLLAGGGILQKPAASKTGKSSRTLPGILPSSILFEGFGEKNNSIDCSLN